MKRFALILAFGCLVTAAAQPADELEQQLTILAQGDPDTPAVLEAQLERVDTLRKLDAGSCGTSLAAAQAALTAAAGAPALPILLPLGPARLASLDYELHRARAQCAGDPGAGPELQKAVAAAQHGVELYRDALDYPDMAIMQYNLAVTQRLLGDADAAVAALTTAIDMDHELGLTDDAADNERLLAEWRAPAAAPPPANAAAAPPGRSIPLHFAWTAGDAAGRIEVISTYLVEGHVAQATATKSFTRQVRPFQRPLPAAPGGGQNVQAGWRVSYDLSGAVSANARGFAEHNVLFGLAQPVTQALLERPDFGVSDTGELRGFLNLGHVVNQLRERSRDAIRAALGQRSSVMQGQALDNEFAPLAVLGRGVEDYDLETGAWIGAALEQGVWYQMMAGLSLPGLTDTALPHDVQFVFARNVPCAPASTAPACAEIVLHATPDGDALQDLLINMSTMFKDARYWSTTYARIVTDPRSLTPYCIDVRRYWHLSGRVYMDHGPESGMQRVVTTYSYPASQSGQAPAGGAQPAQ